MELVTLSLLERLLNERQVAVSHQSETEQLLVQFQIRGLVYPLFIRMAEGGDYVQLLIFIPLTLKVDKLDQIARLLHYMNKEVAQPGFCVDELHQLLFYRLMVPTTRGSLDGELFLKLVEGCKMAAEHATGPIAAVNSGQLSLRQFIERMEKSKQSPSHG